MRMDIRKLIRGFMNRRGYEIVKTEDYGICFPSPSVIDELSFYKTPIGDYYLPINSKRDLVASAMRRGKIFEEEIVNLALPYIKHGSVVLDVGANYGQMSLLFSKAVGDNGEVYSFEAQEFVFEILKKNIEANHCKNIIPLFGAVYDKPGLELIFPKADFMKFDAYGSYGIDPIALTGDRVKSLTIDSIKFEKPISFMKIDIQGSDLFALRGAVNTIKKHKMPIVFEFEDQFQDQFNTSFQDYVDFVNEIGYKFKEVKLNINYLIVPK
jgi:FkbM family methyltransferase